MYITVRAVLPGHKEVRLLILGVAMDLFYFCKDGFGQHTPAIIEHEAIRF